MNYSWSQPYYPEGKYNRLFTALKILQSAEQAKILDRLEPVTDVTGAAKYLRKFMLDSGTSHDSEN